MILQTAKKKLKKSDRRNEGEHDLFLRLHKTSMESDDEIEELF